MGIMALCPTVRLLFPSGMAIRHRASSPLLPSFLVIRSSPSLFFLVLGYFLVWPSCPYVVCIAVAVLAVLSLRGAPWFPYRRYAGNSTFKRRNKVSPPLGHWNPETLEPRVEAPGHWNPETLEPRVEALGHWNAKCTGRRKGTDPRTCKVHRPKERFSFFRYPLGSHWRSLRCAFHCRAAHGVYDVLGGARWLQVQFLVSFFFPETLRRGAVRGSPGFRRRLSILELMLLSEGQCLPSRG